MRRGSLFLLFTTMMAAIVVLALRLRDEQGPLDAEAVAEVELDRSYHLVEVDDEALGDE